MLNSKIIVATVAVLGLGGIGVAAASGAIKLPNTAGVQGTPSAARNSTVKNSYQVVPSIYITGAEESDLHLNVSETVTSDITDSNVYDVEVGTDFSDTITSTETMTHSNHPAEEIGLKFGEDITDVVQLHNSGWGFGEIYRLYELAKLTNKTPADIQAMRNAGMGWGEIAQALGVKPGNGGDNLGAIMSGHDMTDTESVKNAGNDNEDQGNQGSKSSGHDKTQPQQAQNNGKHGEGNQGKGKKP